jgi:hypothetical protein
MVLIIKKTYERFCRVSERDVMAAGPIFLQLISHIFIEANSTRYR